LKWESERERERERGLESTQLGDFFASQTQPTNKSQAALMLKAGQTDGDKMCGLV